MAQANHHARRTRARGGRDLGASEVISFVFMMGLGAIALTVSLAVMNEAREDGAGVAAGVQLKQVGEIVAAQVEDATRVAQVAPDMSYRMAFDVPPHVGEHSYNVTIEGVDCSTSNEGGTIQLTTDDGLISTTVPLGNAAQVQVKGTCLLEKGASFHSSASTVDVIYDKTTPAIRLQPTT